MGAPRVYISSNAGARIGLAREVQSVFRVAFVDKQPSKGIAYLYLTPKDYESVKDSVAVEKITDVCHLYIIALILEWILSTMAVKLMVRLCILSMRFLSSSSCVGWRRTVQDQLCRWYWRRVRCRESSRLWSYCWVCWDCVLCHSFLLSRLMSLL